MFRFQLGLLNKNRHYIPPPPLKFLGFRVIEYYSEFQTNEIDIRDPNDIFWSRV